MIFDANEAGSERVILGAQKIKLCRVAIEHREKAVGVLLEPLLERATRVRGLGKETV